MEHTITVNGKICRFSKEERRALQHLHQIGLFLQAHDSGMFAHEPVGRVHALAALYHELANRAVALLKDEHTGFLCRLISAGNPALRELAQSTCLDALLADKHSADTQEMQKLLERLRVTDKNG